MLNTVRCMPKTTVVGALAGLILSTACATTQPIPRELVDARDAYNRAVAGPGAELAPAQLHTAKQSLDRAEKSFEEEPEAVETRDLAYIAQRKSQLAESEAGAELAKQQHAQAHKGMSDAKDTASAQTEQELAAAKEMLAKAQMESKDALMKLGSLKNSVKQEERGLVITLSGNVLFGSGKSVLLPAARNQLDEIAHALVGAKSQTIVIEGHTDATGSREINASLGHKRAQAVADYFVQKGLPQDHIPAVGKGPDSPIANNKTAEGRASNRRVEIVVQGRGTQK
jgi:outer membrane protein OmpA-like peptidoglycan-associated protein